MSRFVELKQPATGGSPVLCGPGESIVFTWRVRNDSTLPWPPTTELQLIGGDMVSVQTVPIAESLQPGQEGEVSAVVNAPGLAGLYQCFFRLAAPGSGRFGQRLWAEMNVGTHA